MNVELKKLCTKDEFTFEAKEKLRIGTMRVDFASGPPASKWTPSEFMKTFIDKFGIDAVNEVQAVVNDIQFRLLSTFDKVVDTCGGFGYRHETNRFIEYGKFNYWIRLIPVRGDYNYYIKIYLKEELN